MSHPVHPAIVHFPIACWTLATLGDFSSIWLGERLWWTAGLLHIIGTTSAIAAMISGFFELKRISDADNGSRVVDIHMQLVFITWGFYTASLLMRIDKFHLTAPGPLELSLSGLGLLTLFAAGWFGGKLVYEVGVGVSKG